MESTGYSLSDIAAATGNGNGNNNGGFGGDGAWWIILFFIFAWGWGGNGFGGFGNGGGSAMQGALTRGDLCMDMNFAELKSTAQNTADAVALGFSELNSTICHQQYDTAQQLNAMNIANMQNANAANVVALQNANAIQAQLADCCCKEQTAIQGVNFNMAQNTCAITNQMNNNTRDIIQSQEAGTRAILDYLCQDKIATLQSENSALRLAASQERQNAYLIEQLNPRAVPAYPAASPCGLGNWSPQVLANGYGFNNCCCNGNI